MLILDFESLMNEDLKFPAIDTRCFYANEGQNNIIHFVVKPNSEITKTDLVDFNRTFNERYPHKLANSQNLLTDNRAIKIVTREARQFYPQIPQTALSCSHVYQQAAGAGLVGSVLKTLP